MNNEVCQAQFLGVSEDTDKSNGISLYLFPDNEPSSVCNLTFNPCFSVCFTLEEAVPYCLYFNHRFDSRFYQTSHG